jgi:hypothetical protein
MRTKKKKRPEGRFSVDAIAPQAGTVSATSLKSAILSKFMYW